MIGDAPVTDGFGERISADGSPEICPVWLTGWTVVG
jgi:hypothetical protein